MQATSPGRFYAPYPPPPPLAMTDWHGGTSRLKVGQLCGGLHAPEGPTPHGIDQSTRFHIQVIGISEKVNIENEEEMIGKIRE